MSDTRARTHERMASEDLGAAVAAAREAMRAGSPRAVRQALRALTAHTPTERRRDLTRRVAELSLRADMEWLDRRARSLAERDLSVIADLAEGRPNAYAPANEEALAVRRIQREPESIDALQSVVQSAAGRASDMRQRLAVGARMDHGPEAEARVLDAAQRLIDDVVTALVEACEVRS